MGAIEISDVFIKELLEHDINNVYGNCLNVLSHKYSRLNTYRVASKKEDVDDIVMKATLTAIDAVFQADILFKQANFDKEAGMITKIILKTLKIAQKILAGLLIKSPLKVGIAYNAMHNVIKFIEKEIIKKAI